MSYVVTFSDFIFLTFEVSFVHSSSCQIEEFEFQI